VTLETTRATLPAWATRLAVFDLETTGIDVETSRIVTANVSILDELGQVVDRHDWIADPGVEIPEGASAVHGITTEEARAVGRRAADVVDEVVFTLRTVMSDSYAVVAYNAPYDFTLLDRECHRHGIRPLGQPGPVVDPLVIDRRVDRYRKGKRTLTAATGHYGVTLTDAHNAGADAIAAGRVALALAERYAADLAFDARALHREQIAWHDEQCASFEEYMRTRHDPHFTARRGWPLIPVPAHPTLF
jgi:DNA polymerase III subunit epsilon